MEDDDLISEDEEDLDTDELAERADDKVDVLIDLLVEKGVITEEEFEKKYDELFGDEEGEPEP